MPSLTLELQHVFTTYPNVLITLEVLALLVCAAFWLFQRPSIPQTAPPRTKDSWPILGSLVFFTHRWDFCRRSRALSPSGHFSFYAGQHPVIALSGTSESSRKLFFDSARLSAAEAYSVLLAGIPSVKKNPLVDRAQQETDLTSKDAVLRSRITAIMRPDRLASSAEWMMEDVRKALLQMQADGIGRTDPFVSLYKIVFQLTVRMTGCNEIADGEKLRDETLYWFEEVANATKNPLMIMFPWFPVWGKARRMYAGARLYGIFDKVMRTRRAEKRRERDTLQVLMDEDSSTLDVIEFVLGALFAGQNNSGLQVAWILVHLACNAEWKDRVREEIIAVASRHAQDKSIPLFEQLQHVPCNAWIDDFKMIDLCLKETVRLGMPGTIFRKNIGADLPIPGSGGEVIPADTYVAMHVYDAHLNSDIWSDPHRWDPSRFLPKRAEDKRQNYTWLGWGHGRHPCLGVRFAKLEIMMIVAMWFALFPDFTLVDENDEKLDDAPRFLYNEHGTHRPDQKVFLRFAAAQ